jgi:hypothetical protein
MSDSKALKIIRSRVQETVNSYSESILQGNVKDFTEYRYLCGVIHGLNLADRELVDLLSALEHDEDV